MIDGVDLHWELAFRICANWAVTTSQMASETDVRVCISVKSSDTDATVAILCERTYYRRNRRAVYRPSNAGAMVVIAQETLLGWGGCASRLSSEAWEVEDSIRLLTRAVGGRLVLLFRCGCYLGSAVSCWVRAFSKRCANVAESPRDGVTLQLAAASLPRLRGLIVRKRAATPGNLFGSKSPSTTHAGLRLPHSRSGFPQTRARLRSLVARHPADGRDPQGPGPLTRAPRPTRRISARTGGADCPELSSATNESVVRIRQHFA